MDQTFLLVAAIITVALIFDYINGFHDAANSIATIVATRVLTPKEAVMWAAFWNFIAAFGFGTGVAKTVGKGMVDLAIVTPYVILAGLIGAIAWDLITWWFGLPTSSTHALVGGYAGAAIAKVALTRGVTHSFEAIIAKGWYETLVFILLAPMIGVLLAYVLMISIFWLFRNQSPARMDRYFRKLQLFSAAVFSYAHGTNDAQKTMGIITGVLVTAGYLTEFNVPIWVIFAAHAAIGLGTLSGGWRIIRTMGGRLTRLKPPRRVQCGSGCRYLDSAVELFGQARIHNPRDCRRDRGRRIHPADEGRPLGPSDKYRLGVDTDDPGLGCCGRVVAGCVAAICKQHLAHLADRCAIRLADPCCPAEAVLNGIRPPAAVGVRTQVSSGAAATCNNRLTHSS
jgi:PiT family inorganic phosphate transporter